VSGLTSSTSSFRYSSTVTVTWKLTLIHSGRKWICQIFCITYVLTCVCLLIPSPPVLILGRILGGISTSILFSAFETWLVSASTNVGLPSADLSLIFGRATLTNGFVAAGAGVVSNQLVASTETFKSPFVASALLLVLSYFVIKSSWTENYGSPDQDASADPFQTKRLRQAWRIVRQDPLLLVLGLTQTCFEGSMYLFVFLWVPSLQEASQSTQLPLGNIFSAFMVSMMLGSVLYTFITQTLPSLFSNPASKIHPTNAAQGSGNGTTISALETTDSANGQSLTLHAKLSSGVCAVSALALAASVSGHAAEDETLRFWSFCLFEACVGMYYPVQGMLRGSLVSNEHRATVGRLHF
jgi:MFS transporter, MFS domain-containing protein family, molybdate-anion transporter